MSMYLHPWVIYYGDGAPSYRFAHLGSFYYRQSWPNKGPNESYMMILSPTPWIDCIEED